MPRSIAHTHAAVHAQRGGKRLRGGLLLWHVSPSIMPDRCQSLIALAPESVSRSM
jgi:hypothetical protein